MVALHIKRVEKRQALNMVPVGMGEKQMRPSLPLAEFPCHKIQSQLPNPGAGIENELRSVHLNLHTGSISAETTANLDRQIVYEGLP